METALSGASSSASAAFLADSGLSSGASALDAPLVERQRTLGAPAQCSGVGVHSGARVAMRLLPADPGTGIVFIRTDLKNGARAVPARWDRVVDTRLCTVIGNDHGGSVATIEHLMAALHAAGVDNATVEIDGPEVPVMDGSAAPFMFLLDMAGVVEQNAPRRTVEVLKPVEVKGKGGAVARLAPDDDSRFSVAIAFDRAPIGNQRLDFTLSADGFRNAISRARTFGFYEDVEKLQALGLARGGSLDNAIVIRDDRVMNRDGLRYEDEFVRHKLLDAVGDLALAGGALKGHFIGHCSGHALNNQLLRALFADSSAWRVVNQ